jgi:hypothetical protein
LSKSGRSDLPSTRSGVAVSPSRISGRTNWTTRRGVVAFVDHHVAEVLRREALREKVRGALDGREHVFPSLRTLAVAEKLAERGVAENMSKRCPCLFEKLSSMRKEEEARR